MQKAQISLQTYSVRMHTKTAEEWKSSMGKVRKIGYRSIQDGRVPGLSPRHMRDFMDEIGLEMSSYSGNLDDIHKDIDGFIEECRLFDCDEVMMGTMPERFREDRQAYEKGIALMNQVGKELSSAGIFLSYHNHAQEFRRWSLDGTRAFDLLLEGTDPASVRFMLDTHWIQAGGGDVIEWIRKAKGRARYIHVKDYRIASVNYDTWFGATPIEFAEIGEGSLPWPLIIETCLAQGIRVFIVEQDRTYLRDPFDSIGISFNNLIRLGLTA
jgi:sugar phosphate isomerase/epimerase